MAIAGWSRRGFLAIFAAPMPALAAAALALAVAAPPASGAAARPEPALRRPARAPVIGVAAAARLGVLVGNGGALIQPPLGFGFGLDLRYHALPLGAARLGLGLSAGHDRFADRRSFVIEVDGAPVTVERPLVLHHSDLTVGPSLQIPARVLFIEIGGGGGLAVSSLRRPTRADPAGDEQVVGYDGMVRGDVALGIPIVRDQGLRIGAALGKIFSKKRIAIEPGGTPDTAIFDLTLDVSVAYQAWF